MADGLLDGGRYTVYGTRLTLYGERNTLDLHAKSKKIMHLLYQVQDPMSKYPVV